MAFEVLSEINTSFDDFFDVRGSVGKTISQVVGPALLVTAAAGAVFMGFSTMGIAVTTTLGTLFTAAAITDSTNLISTPIKLMAIGATVLTLANLPLILSHMYSHTVFVVDLGDILNLFL